MSRFFPVCFTHLYALIFVIDYANFVMHTQFNQLSPCISLTVKRLPGCYVRLLCTRVETHCTNVLVGRDWHGMMTYNAHRPCCTQEPELFRALLGVHELDFIPEIAMPTPSGASASTVDEYIGEELYIKHPYVR